MTPPNEHDISKQLDALEARLRVIQERLNALEGSMPPKPDPHTHAFGFDHVCIVWGCHAREA